MVSGLKAEAAGAWRVAVNPERRHSDWWDTARADVHAPAGVRPVLEIFGPDHVFVSSEQPFAIAEWAAGVSGWNDGLHPLLIELVQGASDAPGG